MMQMEQISLFGENTEDKTVYKQTFAYRVKMIKEKKIRFQSEPLSDSKSAAHAVRNTINALGQNDREHFVVLLLNVKHGIIGCNIASVGTVMSAVVHAINVFKPAILMNAPAMIVGHNHPSGNTEPSTEDKAMTSRLAAAAQLMNISIYDHVIVSLENESYYSFTESGLMGEINRNAKNLISDFTRKMAF